MLFKPYRVVFFIFIVSNTGGILTPIGDPPLFLGFLRGVPFWWNLQTSHWPWVFVNGAFLTLFFFIDRRDHAKQERHHEKDPGPAVHIVGIHNFLFIAVIVAAVFQIGVGDAVASIHRDGFSSGGLFRLIFCREMLMLLASVASRMLTGQVIYQRNAFTYGPIKEVAILFF